MSMSFYFKDGLQQSYPWPFQGNDSPVLNLSTAMHLNHKVPIKPRATYVVPITLGLITFPIQIAYIIVAWSMHTVQVNTLFFLLYIISNALAVSGFFSFINLDNLCAPLRQHVNQNLHI
jgi:hypothetical protein